MLINHYCEFILFANFGSLFEFINHYCFFLQVFSTRDELLVWARNVGKSIGSVVVISRSDNGRSSKKAFVILGCEKSGRYKRDKTE